jgi:hypothetical protein
MAKKKLNLDAAKKSLKSSTASIVDHTSVFYSITPSGDVGQKLANDDDMSLYAAYAAVLSLEDVSPARVAAVVRSIKGDGKDETTHKLRFEAVQTMDPDESAKQDALAELGEIDDNGPITSVSALANLPHAAKSARELAIEVSDDASFMATLDIAPDAKEDYEGAPILIAEYLWSRYGEQRDAQSRVTRPIDDRFVEILAVEPGSGSPSWRKRPENFGKNGPFDYYEVRDPDTNSTKSGYITRDFYIFTERGKLYQERVDMCKAIKTDRPMPDTIPQIVKLRDYEDGLKAEQTFWQNKITNAIRKLRPGLQFLKQRNKLRELLGHKVEVIYSNYDVDNPQEWNDTMLARAAKMSKPLILRNVSSGKTAPPKALAQFLRMDIDKVHKMGDKASVAALIDTLKREPRTGKSVEVPQSWVTVKPDGKTTGKANISQAISLMDMVTNFLATEDGRVALTTLLNGDNEKGQEAMSSAFLLGEALDRVTVHYQDQWAVRQKKQARLKEQAAAAELAAMEAAETAEKKSAA